MRSQVVEIIGLDVDVRAFGDKRLDLLQVTDIGCHEKGQFVIGGRGVGCWLGHL